MSEHREERRPRKWHRPTDWGGYVRQVPLSTWATVVLVLCGSGGAGAVSEQRASARDRLVETRLNAICAELDSLWVGDSLHFEADSLQWTRIRRVERAIGIRRLREAAERAHPRRLAEDHPSLFRRFWRGLTAPLRLIAGGDL